MVLMKQDLLRIVDEEIADRTITRDECGDVAMEIAVDEEIAALRELKQAIDQEVSLAFEDYAWLSDLVHSDNPDT